MLTRKIAGVVVLSVCNIFNFYSHNTEASINRMLYTNNGEDFCDMSVEVATIKTHYDLL